MVAIDLHTQVNSISKAWDSLNPEFFLSASFLQYLEKFNYCNQRYYTLTAGGNIKAGAIVYSLPVDLFTFSKKSLKFKMNIIGIPFSVDSSGIIGDENYFNELINHILSLEKGMILCLNYENAINHKDIVQLKALPTLVLNHYKFDSFDEYLSNMRHNYRRRIVKALEKFKNVKTERGNCDSFSDNHYSLYLSIMSKTKTKLEVLSKDFFINLPEKFVLTSYYSNDKLLAWHITYSKSSIFSFLFGGMDYELRDEFDSYYNNLLGVVRAGIEGGFDLINLGQTAENAKARIGAMLVEKKMFLYHKNLLIRKTLKLFSKQLEYKANIENFKIFKS
jgi:hypothetical protein